MDDKVRQSGNTDPDEYFAAVCPTRTVAYLGDAVYELYVREYLVRSGLTSPADLNAAARKFVTASAQSRISDAIFDSLSDREKAAFRRGKNLDKGRVAKNLDPREHCIATGLEVVFGQLFLEKNFSRLDEIFRVILSFS